MMWIVYMVGFATLLQALEMISLEMRPLLVLQLIGAVSIFYAPHPAGMALMLVGTWGTAIRFRGTFNGGSDSMTALLQLICLIALALPSHEDALLLFTALILTLSYVSAGLAKLANPSWRSGHALRELLDHSPFAYASSLPFSDAYCARAVIAFECLFPLAFFNANAALAFLCTGIAFHAANVYYFGLNRFFWIWLAAYPSVYLVAT